MVFPVVLGSGKHLFRDESDTSHLRLADTRVSLGDAEWRRVIDRHDRAARLLVEQNLGRYVKSTGDGILATFDAPTRALRCAFEFNETLDVPQQLGVTDPEAVALAWRAAEALGPCERLGGRPSVLAPDVAPSRRDYVISQSSG
jgi:class 3 adenylate cyclase